MERRKEARTPSVRIVRLVDLDSGHNAAGRTLEISPRGLSLETDASFAPGCLLKIEFDDSILLGEVCYQRPLDGQKFMVGVKVVHLLRLSNAFSHLREALQV